ncbi:hypothetical protein acsn021_13350 [Anaerocolumna cellulosilytica]|uniref:Uncharacterized protein n=1 Tax=Anaerocolumna cellulosilytica TaxID=433286 RepID=A0A6S6QVQ3_9FIRM|nr:glycoside hydrolase family 48 protein [Anaerocolumna cellulosilytica]MBB5195525.1 hypothetical protein [Anaerocolumna cellulosilytica]BCJ93766.1 hypothetical protein acsn021_13350 [Anaerocolumna cellulosilytica]
MIRKDLIKQRILERFKKVMNLFCSGSRRKRFPKVVVATLLMMGMLSASFAPLGITRAPEIALASSDVYQDRFLELWEDIKDPSNGYFSPEGIPYHSIETLIVEAPDYGHVTTSEAFSYYMWLEAMYGKFTGDFDGFKEAWRVAEEYIIPTEKDQPNSSMSKYNPNSPATYAPEWELPDYYPAKLEFNAPVGKDPIHNELVSTYKTSTIYGMHWILDVDNWYGYGRRGDGKSTPSYINTFQRGKQESSWETIPHPSWDEMTFGGRNGFLDLFVGDNSYSKQFRYTNAPDADARAVQATYWADQWADEYGVDLGTYKSKASKMGDYLRYSMFDKYFRKIGTPSVAGTGYDSAHYLLSWYYSWGGGISADWAWKIGSSHNHFGYQNPMAAWILSENAEFKPLSQNGARDWATSLDRQLEFYQWLQSAEGAIAGGASNSRNGRYDEWPAGTGTFYGMGYEENPVYADPGSNTWFGMQAWSMQRIAELYYKTGDTRAKELLDRWVPWVKSVVKLNADGTFAIPNEIDWSGQPDTWTGTYTGNKNLHVSVVSYGTDLGVAGSLSNALLYYSKASGDDEAREIAKEILDRIWTLYRDDKGVAAPEARADYSRFFEQEVFVPKNWTGTMANGDALKSGVTFLDIRSKYRDDPNFHILQDAYNKGEDPVFTYHRFWAQCDVAIANGVYSMLFSENTEPVDNSSITPRTAIFDKKVENQQDVEVTLILNGNTFTGIKDGSLSLVEGTDYTLAGDTVTILSSYLAQKAVGDLRLTFTFSKGVSPVLTITIKDSSVVVVEGNIKVQVSNGATTAQTNGISPKIKLYNTGDTAINLSDVKLRYYYTIDGEKDQSFWCDWTTVGSNNVTASFVKLPTAKTDADYYLEIGFTTGAGELAAGQSIDVQVRFSKSDWSNYTQTNDYSFTGDSSFSDWSKVTGYIGDTLNWGIEPK